MSQAIGSPRGIISGTGVITRPDGSKQEFVFRSEESVSRDQVEAIFGKEMADGMKVVNEGEG